MFGVGYFHNGLSDKGFVEKVDDSQGVEGYYNLALLPSARLSFNLQWLSSIEPDIDDTTMPMPVNLGNQRAFRHGVKVRAGDRCVSWLPF